MEGTGPFQEASVARAKASLHEKMEPLRGRRPVGERSRRGVAEAGAALQRP